MFDNTRSGNLISLFHRRTLALALAHVTTPSLGVFLLSGHFRAQHVITHATHFTARARHFRHFCKSTELFNATCIYLFRAHTTFFLCFETTTSISIVSHRQMIGHAR